VGDRDAAFVIRHKSKALARLLLWVFPCHSCTKFDIELYSTIHDVRFGVHLHASSLLSLWQIPFSFSILIPSGGCSELNYLRWHLLRIFHKIIFRIARRTDSLQAVHLSCISTASTKASRHVQPSRPFSSTSLTIRELSRPSMLLLFDAQTVWRVLCFIYDGSHQDEDKDLTFPKVSSLGHRFPLVHQHKMSLADLCSDSVLADAHLLALGGFIYTESSSKLARRQAAQGLWLPDVHRQIVRGYQGTTTQRVRCWTHC